MPPVSEEIRGNLTSGTNSGYVSSVLQFVGARRVLAVLALMCQLCGAVVALSAAVSMSPDADDCGCPMHDGQACPMHHRGSRPQDDTACRLSCADRSQATFASLFAALGLVPEPSSSALLLTDSAAPIALIFPILDTLVVPDSPPPRA